MDPANTRCENGSTGGIRRLLADVPAGRILFYFLSSRALILLLAFFSERVVQKGKYFVESHESLLEWFIRWDAGIYLRIAAHGYEYDPGQGSSVAFFPLLPLLLRFVGLVIPDPRLAGYLISNGFLLLACLWLWKLVRRDYGPERAADNSVLFFYGPVSFFFSTVYTESLFIFLAIAAVYLAGEKRWLLAAVCGYFAGLTRHVGVLMAAALAVEYFLCSRRVNGEWKLRLPEWQSLKERPVAGLLCVVSPCLGLATYAGYLWAAFGDPLAFIKTEQHWGRHVTYFWTAFSHATHDPFYRIWFFAAAGVAVALLVSGFRLRMRPSHLVIGVLYTLIFFSSGHLEAAPRVLSGIFPFYVTAALTVELWPRLEAPLLALSSALLALSTILFVNGYWFT